jgi:hypothetical protein
MDFPQVTAAYHDMRHDNCLLEAELIKAKHRIAFMSEARQSLDLAVKHEEQYKEKLMRAMARRTIDKVVQEMKTSDTFQKTFMDLALRRLAEIPKEKLFA